MPLWKCYYHMVWATERREPVITPEIERVIVETIKRKSEALGCPILAINGVSDHVHVAVNIPPRVAVAEWVRNVKGLSGREVNAMLPNLEAHFSWQGSYGVLTFGEGYLETVVKYIERQKEHDAENTVNAYLEQMDGE